MIIHWLFRILLLLSAGTAYSVTIDSSQASVLKKLHAALNPVSRGLASWVSNSTICEDFHGVTCNGDGRIVEIYLSSESTYNLNGTLRDSNVNLVEGTYANGTLSPEIGSLTSLNALTLASLGYLTGSIPSSLTGLTNLKFLNLSGNALSGTIDDSFGNLKELIYFDIHGNQELDGPSLLSALNGELPSTLGKLSNLKHLDVGVCNFTGNLSFILNLRGLTYLNLDENNFEVPLSSFIPENSPISTLILSSNKFSGPLDPVVGTLENLTYFDASNNNFSGPIPEFIGNLSKLRTLNFIQNKFTSVPRNFEGLTSMLSLSLGKNLLEGDLPESIISMVQLTYLDLQNNGLVGSLEPVTKLVNLEYLDLSYNKFGDGAPISSSFSSLRNLTVLYLDQNNFSGPVPSELANIPRLDYFACDSCGLSGPISLNLSESVLSYLSLPRNNISGEIPLSFCSSKTLGTLDLSSNSLSGNITKCLSLIDADSFFDLISLANNSLTGGIPASISDTFVTSIQLQNNSLTGTLPTVLPTGIIELDLSHNFFTGSIPPSLGDYTEFLNLGLSFNLISGTLPAQIGSLTFLQTLGLRSCGLIGSIPNSLSNLAELTFLDLSLNSFNGGLNSTILTSLGLLQTLLIKGSSLQGSLPNLIDVTTLSYVDLSANQFSGSIPKFPPEIVSLDLSNNQIVDKLNSSSFSYLKKLDILLLNGNAGISGSIPNLDVSILSLANTNVSGVVPAKYNISDSDNYQFYGTPACSNSLYENSSFCDLPETPDFYSALEFCPPCPEGNNKPNPYIYNTTSTCSCSGYLEVKTVLSRSPFAYFTAETANVLESYLGDQLGINSKQFLVKTAATQKDGQIQIVLHVFGNDLVGLSTPQISNLNFIWSKNIAVAELPGLGLLTVPRTSIVTLYIPPPPPPSITGAPPGEVSKESNKLEWWVITIIAAAGFLIVVLCFAVSFLLFFMKNKPIDKQYNGVPHIPLEDIKKATNGFHPETVLGSGGFGIVYRGVSSTGVVWAVKRAKNANEKTLQDFEKEVDVISRVAHKNVVKLLGYCDEKNEQILVYEFMGKGTLKSLLKGSGNVNKNPLTFTERVDIAIGAAEGLRYIHEFAESTFIHRDIKSDNILLNDNMEAKIADFGFLKNNPEKHLEFHNVPVAGTIGYIDPEYINNFKVTRKSDVYSFGVVLLELITGLPALIKDNSVTDPNESSITSLPHWVQPYIDNVKQMVDGRLGSDYNPEAMKSFVKLAKSCTERFAKYRPHMDEVCRRLANVKNLNEGVEEETIGEEETEGYSSSVNTERLTFLNDPSSSSFSVMEAPVSEVFGGR